MEKQNREFQGIENIDFLGIVQRTIRDNNAQKYIRGLKKNFSPEQEANFVQVLIDFQDFLDRQDAAIENQIDNEME
jgi:hypothetical protein